MDFKLSEVQQAIFDLANKFSVTEIKSSAQALDRDAVFPMEIHRKAHDLGLLGVTIPTCYGGHGLGTMELVLTSEAFAYGCAGIATSLGLNALITEGLCIAGNEDQKREYLGRMAEGGFGCWCLTEPAAGSDVAGIGTHARKVGGNYVINGSKIWITNASMASFMIVFAKTDSEAGNRGLSAFLVERTVPGIEVGVPLRKMGQRASPACEVFFTDVVVPEGNLLGKEGQGFSLAMASFDRSRPMVAAFAVGMIQRCLDESLAYARIRHTMGRPIVEHQVVGHRLAEMRLRLEASRLLTYQAAWRIDNGLSATLQSSSAKLYACDSAMWSASEAVQIHGGIGYSAELPIEKLFRDAKLLQIYEGTSEIQHNIILREMQKQ